MELFVRLPDRNQLPLVFQRRCFGFKHGDPFDIDHWVVPAAFNDGAWDVIDAKPDRITMGKHMQVANYAGTTFVTLDMLGSYRYGSDLLNIAYDPTIAEELATFAFDDDGLKALRRASMLLDEAPSIDEAAASTIRFERDNPVVVIDGEAIRLTGRMDRLDQSGDERRVVEIPIADERRFITADTLGYLSEEGMLAFLKPGEDRGFCDACFTKRYPIPVDDMGRTMQLKLFNAEDR